MFPAFFVGLAYPKNGSPCNKCWGNNPKKKHKCHDHGQPKEDTPVLWNAILQTISKFSLFFSTCSPSFASQSVPFLKIYSTGVPFQQGHWCISAEALVHFNAASLHLSAGIGACQWGHWCISMTTYWRISMTTYLCISIKALVHFNGCSSSGQW